MTDTVIEPRFSLIPFDQVTVGTERLYLVKGLIPRTGLVVAWGPPKCGKSFWTFDLVMHIALGWEYRGRRVQQGPIVYLALEGGKGFEARIEAFRQRHLAQDAGPVPFYLVSAPVSLVKDHSDLTDCIRLQARGSLPVAVVIDTLNRSLAGSESNDEDMAAYIRAADAIRDVFKCAVIVVHHCGIDGTRPRGHTSLTGAADAQLAVKRDGAQNILVTVEWMKDGPEGDVLASRLDAVEVGQDIDGDAITSCIVVPAEVPVRQSAANNRKLNARQQLAIKALDESLITLGAAAPGHLGLPGNTIVVESEAWRKEIHARGAIDAEAANPREDFRRIRDQLHARQIIGVRDDLVWRA